MKARLLGSGTSSGVPRLGPHGPDWGSCDPSDPRNRRLRASLIVETATTRLLIDTSPDLREQLLTAGAPRIDAVLWTHEHADHTHGIDDLRQLFQAQGAPIPCYARPEAWRRLVNRFSYAWQGNGGYPALLTGRAIEQPLRIGDIDVGFIDMPHGGITSAGYRFTSGGKSVGYATDFQRTGGQMQSHFRNLDLLVIDALRRKPHPTHPHLQMTLDFIAAVKPARAVLMHMDSSMDYATLAAELPDGVQPGFDGLEISL
jgi:phosphoribosyl 1,2-cyclic phosphate phosphodiesterase